MGDEVEYFESMDMEDEFDERSLFDGQASACLSTDEKLKLRLAEVDR